MKNEQDLFELVNDLGEMLKGHLHIIDTTDTFVEGEKSYRVYHKKGICFDIKKEVKTENEETGEVEEWSYCMYNEWDGFSNQETIDEIYKLIKKSSKK